MQALSHIYILPGGSGRNDAHWYSWLKQQLLDQGFAVTVCAQNRVSPLKRARQLQDRFSLGSTDILVGHSFGGLTALKWVELSQQSVAGLVLVDVSVQKAFESIPQQLLDEAKTKQKRQNLRRIQTRYLESWNWKINLPAVGRQVGRVVMLSENRTAEIFLDWRPEHIKMAKALRSKLITGFGTKQHFTAKQEPKVLNAIRPLLSE